MMSMRPVLAGALMAVLILVLIGALAVFAFVKTTGLSARATPGPVEKGVARQLRTWAVPTDYRSRVNPVPRNDESIRTGLEHFADHCAICHANDGSGDTEMGKGLFPPSPDMRGSATQSLTDAELFYVIEHGIRFTGMPAWGTGTSEGEEASWHIVNFIRHLPRLTPDELEQMTGMNPQPPAETREEIEAERFLRGEEIRPAEPSAPRHEHGGRDE
jgi:mono/diheme cytochrome c family protein